MQAREAGPGVEELDQRADREAERVALRERVPEEVDEPTDEGKWRSSWIITWLVRTRSAPHIARGFGGSHLARLSVIAAPYVSKEKSYERGSKKPEVALIS
jgi:hypothetical protein